MHFFKKNNLKSLLKYISLITIIKNLLYIYDSFLYIHMNKIDIILICYKKKFI